MPRSVPNRQIRRLLEEGVCVVPDVLSPAETRHARDALLEAVAAYRAHGGETFMPVLDPNDRNVRVFNLLEHHPAFRQLILHPTATALVEALLGEHWMISNFTANIALPGSGSMALHSDQALVAPEPWLAPWSMNVIWCLDDVYEANGATRYLPGSQQFRSRADLPVSARADTRAFEAPAGSILAMDGRVWHTSGANVTGNAQRALLFGYYSLDFLRPQVNWNAVLSDPVQCGLGGELRERLGLGPAANVRHAAEILGDPV
ncbi:MAG TPA: phytanoyl-CoA dioxygenase family protein [Pseudomonadales bacterium]